MSLSATPQKFAFDLDLSQSGKNTSLIGERELASRLKQAEEKGYQRGVQEGQNTEANRAASAMSKAAAELAIKTIQIAKKSDELQQQTLCAATELGVSVGKKLAANLIARAPLAEIQALIAECLGSLENIPHLVIRCHPDLAQAVENETKSQMQTSGFSGRLIVMGEPDILLGDARLEWVDGGLVRDLSKMSEQIDERVNIFIRANCPQTSTNQTTHTSPTNEPDANPPVTEAQ